MGAWEYWSQGEGSMGSPGNLNVLSKVGLNGSMGERGMGSMGIYIIIGWGIKQHNLPYSMFFQQQKVPSLRVRVGL